MTNKRKIINDPVYGFLTIEDDLIFDVLQHPYFQRQRHIKQLGLTYLVYPGAVHNRFSHMLGALNLMCRAIDVLKMKGVQITHDEELGVKLAILLHDIGHGPFSHTSEFVLVNVHHEVFSSMFMCRLNEQFGGRLDTAIAIFEDTYPKRYLHQLVSGQLDMDRLDYLSRDSFYSGVSEGIVGTERIINMLNVRNDELVVDEKGVYSIEKFIISRRLMYWQVYMHKTVIAADAMLLSVLRRARNLIEQGMGVDGPQPLMEFLSNRYTKEDFERNSTLLDKFAMVDDTDVTTAIKGWMLHDDFILRTLATNLINRRLPAIREGEQPFEGDYLDTQRSRTQLLYAIDESDADYFVTTGKLLNHAYDFNDREIKVLFKTGEVKSISEASDQLDRHFLEKSVTKYYITFPKELK